MPAAESAIPFIDFADFGDGTTEVAKVTGQRFFAACRDVGFAYLINTGIPVSSIDSVFAESKRFFELPQEIKMLAPHPERGDLHRGYSGIGVEQVSQMVFDKEELAALRKKAPDFKESFDMGSESSRKYPNQWVPEEHLPGFKARTLAFQAECRQLQLVALKALAIGMGLEPDFFESYHSDADNQLRFLHYPSAPTATFASGEKGRIAAHTDFGTCTFLFQDDCGGLEVEDPHRPGVFLPAPPIPGAVIFNIGDFLMRWSNDTLKSTLHRVRAPPPREGDEGMTCERYSIPYFCSANIDQVIDALPGTWSEENPKKYSPIVSGEYIAMRMRATYVEKE